MRRRRGRYGAYHTYHGRGRLHKALRIILIVIIILIVLALVSVFWLENYIVYTDDGLRFDLPSLFGSDEDTPTDAPPASSMLIVFPSDTPVVEDLLHAVSLPLGALSDGTASGQVSEAGCNAAIFDMKADSGALGYVSDLELAKVAGTSASTPGLNDAIRETNGGDLYTIARVSCFRDNAVPYARNATAIRTAAGNWRDLDGIRWLSPAKESARSYVVGVCTELAALGFDEILLDYSTFPVDGRVTLISEDYDPDNLSTSVETFYSDLVDALSAYPDVKVSIVSSTAAITGAETDTSGQTSVLLARYADRVWLPAADSAQHDACVSALSDAGLANAAGQLIQIVSTAEPGEKNWAILSAD
ncbi:MAG: putative glycoside hydrolase [Oscillospiraceae bacterium]|nr:putative glycoside hydrolase [Oscillospiraceae bacterium]